MIVMINPICVYGRVIQLLKRSLSKRDDAFPVRRIAQNLPSVRKTYYRKAVACKLSNLRNYYYRLAQAFLQF